jgi:predicted ArsR family transcriptional regulator
MAPPDGNLARSPSSDASGSRRSSSSADDRTRPADPPTDPLQLITTLAAVSEAEFATLRTVLGVSDSVLSKHVAALVDVGYLHSRKSSHLGRRTTWITLTDAGRNALQDHVAALRRLIDVLD